MATKTLPKPSLPAFSRLTGGGTTNSWKSAIPIVLVVVAVIAALAYLASQLTSSSEKLAAAQRESEASKQSVEGFQKQASQLQADNALLRTAGRTTVMLESAKPAARSSKKKSADVAAPAAGWAAATWGEAADGKSWLRVAAYGLEAPVEGKTYHLWFTPTTGAPVDAGKLDPAADGSAFAMMKDLPGVDQGKSLEVALNDEGAKEPGTALMTAQLPALKPTFAPPKAAAAPAAAPAAPAKDAASARP
jgi:anti-sigma-K factor RskA